MSVLDVPARHAAGARPPKDAAPTAGAVKDGAADPDLGRVHYERLVLTAGDNALTLQFHPRLTVIAGVGADERDLLIAELLGALAGSRSGVYLEVRDEGGRRVGITRAAGAGPDRVVDLDTRADATEELAGAATGQGRLDLLGMLGVGAETARLLCRVTAAELAAQSRADAVIASLAALDQSRLWATAERLVIAEQGLADEARHAEAVPEEAPAIGEVERRHKVFEAAVRRTRSTRHDAIFIAGTCAPAAGAAVALHSQPAAIGFVGLAAVMTAVSVVFRRRAEAARQAELAALSEVGAESYFGFELQRIDALLASNEARSRVAAASEERKRALAAWSSVAGQVDPQWALAHRDAITARAEQARAGTFDGARMGAAADAVKLAEWLVARFVGSRRVGAARESVPLIFDDPFVGLDAGTKRWALGMIARFAGFPQAIYLTSDPDIVAWARAEAMTGELTVIDPVPDAAQAHAGARGVSAESVN